MNKPYNSLIAEQDLKYYIFDWDDNILHMPTYIHLERKLPDGSWVPHLVSTALYSVIRKDKEHYRPPQGVMENAFVEFRDFANEPESKFLTDAKTALQRIEDGLDKLPPSFNVFKKSLIEGRIFAIVTARGHSSETLRKGVELFINKVLTPYEKEEMIFNLRGYTVCFDGIDVNNSRSDEEVLQNYLNLNKYHAVTSPNFKDIVPEGDEVPPSYKSEQRKKYAILDFLEHLFGIIARINAKKPISVGFSDDDPLNVQSLTDFIKNNLSQKFPGVKFVVYDTSDPTLEKGRKIIVSGQSSLF